MKDDIYVQSNFKDAPTLRVHGKKENVKKEKVHMYIVLTLCEFMKSRRLSYLDRKPTTLEFLTH